MAKDDDKILSEVKTFFDRAASFEMQNRTRWLEDIKFYEGEQWNDKIQRQRENDPNGARPCLVINKLPLHVKQVTNDVRQNPPAIKVHPVDDKADTKTAEILNGILRHIEYQSDADVAYFTANENQVIAGVGYWRVVTDILDEETNEQDIFIRPIHNIFSVYFDPNSTDPYGADAERVLITEEIGREEFKERYPDAELHEFDTASVGDTLISNWVNKDTVRIGEYWVKEEITTTKLMVDGGEMLTEDEYWAAYQGDVNRPIVRGKRSFSVEKVRWYKTNGTEILEQGEWAGRYIPIVRVPGEVIHVEGRTIYKGIVSNAKDAQRMYNYWVSAETEQVALRSKAPYVVAAGQLDGFEDRWAAANNSNLPYLEYNQVDSNGNPAPPPQRQGFDGSPIGVLQAKAGAADDIKATTGQFDASLGMRSNETSGKAIMARQREGDTGTYHYLDNVAKAIRLTGRIIIDLIPKIYDTQRVVRIIGIDESVDQAIIDPNQKTPTRKVWNAQGEVKTIYNPSIGKYDVTVSQGTNYTTKRQEAFDAMTQMVSTNPELWNVVGDLIVKAMDWDGAEAMSKRLKAMLPPQIQQLEAADEETMPPQAQAQIQQLQEQLQQYEQGIHDATTGIQQRDQALQEAQKQIEQLKQQLSSNYQQSTIDLQVSEAKAQSDIAKAEADKVKAQAEVEKARMEVLKAQFAPQEGQEDAAEMQALQTIQQQIDQLAQIVASKQEPDDQVELKALTTISMQMAQLQQASEATANAIAQATQILSQPKKKTARAVKQADGTYVMESIEE